MNAKSFPERLTVAAIGHPEYFVAYHPDLGFP